MTKNFQTNNESRHHTHHVERTHDSYVNTPRMYKSVKSVDYSYGRDGSLTSAHSMADTGICGRILQNKGTPVFHKRRTLSFTKSVIKSFSEYDYVKYYHYNRSETSF